MSRSGYREADECESVQLWRANVERTIRGKCGQAFLREMIAALDALPEKKLSAGILVEDGECCAIGSVAIARKLDLDAVDETEPTEVADLFGISSMLAQEIAYQNDEREVYENHKRVEETPESRWARMRAWSTENLRPAAPPTDKGEGATPEVIP